MISWEKIRVKKCTYLDSGRYSYASCLDELNPYDRVTIEFRFFYIASYIVPIIMENMFLYFQTVMVHIILKVNVK